VYNEPSLFELAKKLYLNNNNTSNRKDVVDLSSQLLAQAKDWELENVTMKSCQKELYNVQSKYQICASVGSITSNESGSLSNTGSLLAIVSENNKNNNDNNDNSKSTTSEISKSVRTNTVSETRTPENNNNKKKKNSTGSSSKYCYIDKLLIIKYIILHNTINRKRRMVD
jgi:hypothetical protein